MEIISWNVNGINSLIEKGLLEFVEEQDADCYLLQEIKSGEDTINKKILNVENYKTYWNPANKKGYSGVITLTKKEPMKQIQGIGEEKFDKEGRVLTLEFDKFYLLNVYVVNAGRGLTRLEYKMKWNAQFLDFIEELKENKPVVIGGDFNVAHKEKDLANPQSNFKNAGFTPEEREWFSKFLDKGYVDNFREFNKEGGNYTFWSYMHNARERNIGWRLDYFVVNEKFKENIKKSEIMEDVMGSDHCPIKLNLEL